jgi:F0F1-type ATP synthase membrane subunit b/b'
MKKVFLLATVVTIAVMAAASVCVAQSSGPDPVLLEQKAQRIQAQIEQAKAAAQAAAEQQINGIQASIDALVKQRVAIDAHISKLEGQIQQVKQQAQENLSRQIDRYNQALSQVKQQMSGSLGTGTKLAGAGAKKK